MCFLVSLSLMDAGVANTTGGIPGGISEVENERIIENIKMKIFTYKIKNKHKFRISS